MSKCIALATIAAVANCVDTDNRAGIVDRILFGYAEEVGTWPTLPIGTENAPLTLAQAGAWDGDLAMANGCQLYELNITDETGELKITD